MPTLYRHDFSAWSVKAMWALNYHDTACVQKDVLSPVTDWFIKFQTGNYFGRVTFPVLIKDHGSALTESFDISHWSSKNMGGKSKGDLFGGFDIEELKAWDTKAHEMLAYGRIRTTEALLEDDQGIVQVLPKFVRLLGPLAIMIAKWGIRRVRDKYIGEPGVRDPDKIRANLLALREAVKGGNPYILGKFSFADITMAIGMHMVKPIKYIPLPELFVQYCSVPSLAEEFSDLLEWREMIFEKHFGDTRKTV